MNADEGGVRVEVSVERLREILGGDPIWTLYMLGDLEPERWPHAEWRCGDAAVVLLYREFGVPVLLAAGALGDVRRLLDELSREESIYLHVQTAVAALVERDYEIDDRRPMIRMALVRDRFVPASVRGVAPDRLGGEHRENIAALYRDGEAAGESPGFYTPEMLEQKTYVGVWEGEDLVAAAGTHLVSEREGVAAIGNVYTRRDRRGRGLAAAVTSAVAAGLIERGIGTIGLSVGERNAGAIRVYERLGFVEHCRFLEGLAHRRDG